MSKAPAKAPVLAGKGSVDLPTAVFTAPFHESLVHEVVRAELAARRRGTASTRTRAQVHGGGAKPWRQKGTGRARIGSIRAPHWVGGGVAFGPTPRRYTIKVNRRARRSALRSALSMHAGRGSMALVNTDAFKEPSTRQAAEALKTWTGTRYPVLVLLGGGQVACMKSFRNIDRVDVRDVDDAGVADIVGAGTLVVSQTALKRLEQLAGEMGSKRTSDGAASDPEDSDSKEAST